MLQISENMHKIEYQIEESLWMVVWLDDEGQ